MNQKLAEHISEETKERRRTFYIVARNGIQYFVKEYTDREYGGKLGFPKNIEYEFNETKRLYGAVETKEGIVNVPKTYALEDNRILFEYLDGYSKSWQGDRLLALVYKWVSEKRIDNYDLNANNAMIKMIGDKLDIKMIDFECSEDRHPMKEMHIE